jgi:steroid delta-isomerase-like uncharacterized protein
MDIERSVRTHGSRRVRHLTPEETFIRHLISPRDGLTAPKRFGRLEHRDRAPRGATSSVYVLRLAKGQALTIHLTANAQIAVTIFEAWNTKDYARAYGVLADDFKAIEVPTGDTYVGADGLLQEYNLWHAALSDGRIDVTTAISSGDHVAIESVVRGTHDGPFETRDGELPASGRAIMFEMCTIAYIKDGKYALERHYFDMKSLLAQFGAQ